MTKGQLLQDPFLNSLRKGRIPVSIYLVNGIKLQGPGIESFDQYVVLLRDTVTQMVYKHAISTVVPARAVPLGNRTAGELLKKQKPYSGLSISKGRRRRPERCGSSLSVVGPRNSSGRGT